MAEDSNPNRRRFLKYSGVAAAGAVTTLAGCLGDGDGDGDGTDGDGDGDGTDGDGDGDGMDGDGDGDGGLEVTVTQGTFAQTLDPNGHNDTPTNNFLNQAYEPVLYRDRDGQVIENIATDFRRTGDNQVELDVRDGVTFHNGDEMTAEDVAFSINRTNDPDVSAQAGVVGSITEARAEDGSVVIDLETVEPAIFRNLSAFGRVMSQEWTEERDAGEVAEDIMGTGPYRLEEFVDDTRVVYERFDDYWGEHGGVERATFNNVEDEGTRVDRLVTGESDLVVNVNPRDISEVEDEDGVRVEDVPSIRSIFLVMNDAKEPFDSQEFRQAMNYAVDVQAIIDSILNGFGELTSQPTLEGHFGYNPDVDPYPHDPGQAEQLVDESGHDGADITIHSTTGRYLRDTDIAETAAGQIDELSNVSAGAEPRDTDTLFGETIDGDQETSPGIFLIGWGNPTFDANYTMAPWFLDTVFQHYRDEELTDLITQANEVTGDERENILQEANALANERAPWVFLHQQFSIYGVNDDVDWDARQDEDINLIEMDSA